MTRVFDQTRIIGNPKEFGVSFEAEVSNKPRETFQLVHVRKALQVGVER
jgi:hypothetical protein